MPRFDDFDWYRFKSQPVRQAKGGIKAQTKQGSFAQQWWGKRWLEVLESFELGSRLQRGRSYARRGQVLSIDVRPGGITAKVQGSRPKPYAVEIRLKPFTPKEIAKAREAVAAQALYTAKLLAGELPPELEQVLKEAGLPLFPGRANDLQTECSCPDWSNPCKHIAAVYYLLAEQFDHDPFLLLKLRGIERTNFLRDIHRETGPEQLAPSPPPEPLPLQREPFWNGIELAADWLGEVRTATAVPAALPRRLGPLRFWRAEERFLEAMDRLYARATQFAGGGLLLEPEEMKQKR